MGDRGNVVFKEDEDSPEIYFYTHWAGTELPRTVAAALDRGRSRWDDEPYLARIIFSEMIKDEVEDVTGYGISTSRGDGGTEVYINAWKEEVVVESINDDDSGVYTYGELITKFKDYSFSY